LYRYARKYKPDADIEHVVLQSIAGLSCRDIVPIQEEFLFLGEKAVFGKFSGTRFVPFLSMEQAT
jgi:hypothetical protein